MEFNIVYFSLFLGIILLFSGGFVMESFAVDYVDSYGYTPSWASGNGYHTVLVKCTQVSGDGSSDSYWCLEWMAYVLDQGVENFPQSTSETSSPTPSTTKIDPNDLVTGDLYFGSLTKYLPPNPADWVTGDPFTLPQTDNAKNADVTDNVAQGIFVHDIYSKNNLLVATMILEFENNFKAKEFFDTKKIEIQNEINSQNSIEDIPGGGSVYFDDCKMYLKNFDLPDESSRYLCVRDKYIVSVSANQFGGYVTDKSLDYVLPEEVAYDISTKIGKNIDVTFQKIIDKQSGGLSISDEKSCKALIAGAKWNNNGCVAKSLSVESGEILTIYRGVILINSNGVFKNSGTINVLGGIHNWGTFENFGIINVSGQVSIDDNSIINKGTIMINDGSSVVVQSEGALDNFGTISNNDQLINHGKINNHCDGVISGNPVGMRDFGIGKIPIKQITCETISEKTSETTSSAPSETKTYPSSNIVSQEKIESSENSAAESGLNAIGTAFAVLLVIVMPILFVVLIVLKAKNRLPPGMFKKIMKIVGILFLALIVIGITLGALS
jgi:hypothetical protein